MNVRQNSTALGKTVCQFLFTQRPVPLVIHWSGEKESIEISLPSKACLFVPCSAGNICSIGKDMTLKRANLKAKVALRMMFITENLSASHKYYGSLAKHDTTEDNIS
jgi:hypothetical protein